MREGPVLVVGLGNPGREYERTRHNVGFLVVETLAARLGARMRPAKGMRALVAETRDRDRRIVIVEPTTYMNVSGEAVRELARYYKVPAEDVVVVHDDLDLPLGTIRVKRGGGDGGHNGLRSVTRCLRTPEYARVRIGIGRPPGRREAVDYVLEPFSKQEEEALQVVLEQGADVALEVVREGIAQAQNRVHGRGDAAEPKRRRIRKQIVVEAPPAEVYAAWTTSAGAQSFLAPRARIALEEDGPYEVYFDPAAPEGSRGSEGCRVLAYEPDRSLSFSWNNPPSSGLVRSERTRVDLAFRSVGKERTRVTLTHTGWGEGPEWHAAYEYFEGAWDVVLDRLKHRFAEGPVQWNR